MQEILNFFNPKYIGKHSKKDMPKNMPLWLQLPMYVFLGSFATGTTVFLASTVLHTHDLLYAGLFFTVSAVFINLAFLLAMIVYAIIYKKYAVLILKKTSVLLLNIPVTILYIYITYQLNF